MWLHMQEEAGWHGRTGGRHEVIAMYPDVDVRVGRQVLGALLDDVDDAGENFEHTLDDDRSVSRCLLQV